MFSKTKNLHRAMEIQTQETRSTLASNTSRLNLLDNHLRTLSTQVGGVSTAAMASLMDRVDNLEERILQLEAEKAAQVKTKARSRKPKTTPTAEGNDVLDAEYIYGIIQTSDETNS